MFRRILAGFLATALAAPSILFANGGGECQEEVCARYSLRLEALGLKRSSPEDRVLATDSVGAAGPGNTVLDATDFGQEYEFGGRLVMGLRMSPCWTIELSAFGTAPSEQNKSRRDDVAPDTLDTPFAVRGDTGDLLLPTGFEGGSEFQQNEFVEVGFDSMLWSVEVGAWKDLRQPHSTVSARFGGGLRWFELDEDLDYFVDDALAGAGDDSSFTLDNNLKNHLIGVQVGGGVWMHPAPSLAAGVEAKVGAYANWMERDSNLVRGDGLVGIEERGDALGFATVFEVSAETRWDVTPRIGLVAGYRFVLVNGAALGTENLQFNLSDPGEYQDIRDDGSVYWHGPFVGAEFRF